MPESIRLIGLPGSASGSLFMLSPDRPHNTLPTVHYPLPQRSSLRHRRELSPQCRAVRRVGRPLAGRRLLHVRAGVRADEAALHELLDGVGVECRLVSAGSRSKGRLSAPSRQRAGSVAPRCIVLFMPTPARRLPGSTSRRRLASLRPGACLLTCSRLPPGLPPARHLRRLGLT